MDDGAHRRRAGFETYSQAEVDPARGIVAQIREPRRGRRQGWSWSLWEGACSDEEVTTGGAADWDGAMRAVEAECTARGLWPSPVPVVRDVRASLARVTAILRAALAEAEGMAEPNVNTLEDLAYVAEMMAQQLHADARELGPEQVPVKGLFYALGDPPNVDLSPGEVLTLQREPGNENDPKAIGILAKCGTRIGYVPHQISAHLAPQLDAGIRASAWLSDGCGTRWDACLDGPAVLAMRAARKAAHEAEIDDIPF